MHTLFEIGQAVLRRAKSIRLNQAQVATIPGVAAESLPRFERGRFPEFGTGQLLAVVTVLCAKPEIVAKVLDAQKGLTVQDVNVAKVKASQIHEALVNSAS